MATPSGTLSTFIEFPLLIVLSVVSGRFWYTFLAKTSDISRFISEVCLVPRRLSRFESGGRARKEGKGKGWVLSIMPN